MVIILDLSHPVVWLVRHVCSDKAEFSFFAKENRFLMLFQTCTKLTFGLSDVFVVTVVSFINYCVLFFICQMTTSVNPLYSR